MNTPEEMNKELNSAEKSAEPEGKEGELKDEIAEEATGGWLEPYPPYERPDVPQTTRL